MEIKPSELESVESIGELDGEDVKMVKTVGGLYIAVGKLKNKGQEEVLSAGSHPAIVRYGLEKAYRSFRPAMMKSESFNPVAVSGMSDLLPESMASNGYDFYVVKKSNEIEFILTKSQIEVLKFQGSLVDQELILFKSDKVITNELAPVAKTATVAAAIVAVEEGKSTIVHENRKYDAQSILKKS